MLIKMSCSQSIYSLLVFCNFISKALQQDETCKQNIQQILQLKHKHSHLIKHSLIDPKNSLFSHMTLTATSLQKDI